jgi:hypothetical protein
MVRRITIAAILLFGAVAYANGGETNHTDTLSKAKSEREARREAYAAEVDNIIHSRNYIFRPITMQNVVTGNTRSVFAYYLFMGVMQDKVLLHLPVEFTSYVIDTVNLDAYIEDYMANMSDGNWRITFTFMNGAERWLAEIFMSNVTGQARLALVTPAGIMRYLGTIESGATITKKKRKK